MGNMGNKSIYMETLKSTYKHVDEGGEVYFLVSDTPEIASEWFSSAFNIPSYRTIRYYVTIGILERPKKLGKETFFQFNYIIKMLDLFRKLSQYNDSLKVLQKIVVNVKKTNEMEEVLDLLDAATAHSLSSSEGADLIKKLQADKPSKIDLTKLADLPF